MENTKELEKVEKNELMGNDESLFTNEIKKYCTMDLADKNNQIQLYNSLQQCDVRLNDIKGSIINIKDLYIEEKEVTEKDEKGNILVDENGEVKTKKHYRTILYDLEGKTYVSSAYGIYNSLRTIIPIFGNPSSENIIKVKVGSRQTQNGRESLILTIVK